jgi:hypothetical protein
VNFVTLPVLSPTSPGLSVTFLFECAEKFPASETPGGQNHQPGSCAADCSTGVQCRADFKRVNDRALLLVR